MKLKLPRLFILLLATLTLSVSYGQQLGDFCGTPSPTADQYKAMVMQIKQSQGARKAGVGPMVYLPVVYTFVRPSSMKGKPLSAEQTNGMNHSFYLLNKYLRPGNIQFFIHQLLVLDNDADYNAAYGFGDQTLENTRNNLVKRLSRKAINIIIVPRLAQGGSGFAFAPLTYLTDGKGGDQTSNYIFLLEQQLFVNDGLLPHEMGHYFGLLHTFETGYRGKELVNGSNCSVAGDLICDTPADINPYDANATNLVGCAYVGTYTDSLGQRYRPDPRNIMSYWPNQPNKEPCDELLFTPLQYDRMYNFGLDWRRKSSGIGDLYYDLSGEEASIATPRLSVQKAISGVLLTAEAIDGTLGIIIERATSAAGPWEVVQGGYTTTFQDVPLTAGTYFYRARNINSLRYGPVSTFTTTNNLQKQKLSFTQARVAKLSDGPVSLTASSSSGLPVRFEFLGSYNPFGFEVAQATIKNGNQLHAAEPGFNFYRAIQDGNDTYAPVSAIGGITVAPESQTITFASLPDRTLGDPPVLLSATATSGLPVSFAVSGPARLVGNQLTLTGAGVVSVTAVQGGNVYVARPTHYAAEPVVRTFQVLAGKASQQLTFSLDSISIDRTSLQLNLVDRITVSSGLPISMSVVSGPATLSGQQLTFSDYGAVTLQFSQVGNSQYNPATLTRTVCVNPRKPTISTDPGSEFTLVSGSPFRNQWLLNGNTLAGETSPTLAVKQGGNYVVRASNPVAACRSVVQSDARTFVILSVENDPVSGLSLSLSPNPASGQVRVRLSVPVSTRLKPTFDLVNATGQTLRRSVALPAVSDGYETTLDVSQLPAGLYVVRVKVDERTLTGRLVVR